MNKKIKNCKTKIILAAVIVQFSMVLGVYAQNKVDQIDKLVSTYAAYEQFNGSILVAEKGKIIYKKGFGLANMEWGIPNTPDTKHRLGSVTKQFTAMLIMQLVEAGKVKLDAPVSTYLLDYPKPMGDQITIHQLLVHSSGIPNFTSFRKFYAQNSRNHFSPKEFVKVFADSTLQFKAGEKFRYSNSGYFLLGYIIEKISGKSYEQMLKENIFIPLKMNSTGYDHHHTILNKRASGYEKNGLGYINANYLDMSIPYGAGALYSTVEDLYLWDRALYENQLLSKELLELIFQPHISAGNGNYGYGWDIDLKKISKKADSIKTVEHGGALDGFHTFLTRIPEDENLIVVLNNTGKTYLPEMRSAIINILYGASYEQPKKSLARSLLRISTEEGVTSAKMYYQKNKDNETYKLDENEMNMLGYTLLGEGKIKEAIGVFEINVEAFPKSANVYDSLGEVYMTNKQYDLALKNYKKAVALGGTAGNAKAMIRKIEVLMQNQN